MQKSLLIGAKDIQKYLFDHGRAIAVDGVIGKRTRAAIAAQLKVSAIPFDNWSAARRLIAIQQMIMRAAGVGPRVIDGLLGPNTRYAAELWQNLVRDADGPATPSPAGSPWPREKDVPAFYGAPGAHLVRLKLPYKMRLAWNLDQVVTSFALHEKVKDSAAGVLRAVLAHYGMEKIRALGLDVYSGCYSNREKRGGKSLSMHAYGIAIDFDDTHNQFRWTSARARFAKPEYDPWWKIWESHGWVALGRERNYDWMHVQAARL